LSESGTANTIECVRVHLAFRRTLALLCVGSSIAGAIAAACSSSSSGPPPVDQRAKDVITLGAVISLTGSLDYLGGPEETALKVAINQVNALGGVLGKNLDVALVDDNTDPNTSVTAYNNLLAKNPVAFIGPTGSPAAVVVQGITFNAQVINVTPSASTPGLTDAQPAHDRFMFRTCASHALQARALAKWMAKGPGGGAGCRRPAVIYQTDAFGTPIATGFAAAFPTYAPPIDAGVSAGVAISIPVPAAPKGSYATEVQQVISSGADCQLLVLFQALGKQYVIDWVKAVVGDTTRAADKFTTLGCNALQVDSFISATRQNPADPKSASAAEGMYTLNFDTNPVTPEFGVFRNIYTAQYPLAPNQVDVTPYVANTYDATILVALAIAQAGGTTDKVKLRDALFDVSRGGSSYGPGQLADALAAIRAGRDIDYKGASGDVDFDDNGDVLQDFVVFKIQNGAFSLLDRLKASQL
jgi:branched-chain amino acid transport system substrate-binding protein